ncbi:MAG TPA: ankyrin repeat domain-containing protein [Clostridia bacterium]|nr:ankyrin repeat domain-containing protein [Clostridia bacterium]
MKAKNIVHKRILDLIERKDERGILQLVQSSALKPDDWIKSNVPREKFRLLEAALERDWAELAIYLINRGADVNRYSDSVTPLMIACYGQEHRIVEALLAAGADPNRTARRIEDSCGETALMLAAQRQNLWAVKRLLDAGADPKIVTYRKQTAVYFATRPRTQPGTAQVISTLVIAGCPLLGNEIHRPVYRRDVSISKLLLEYDCPPNTLFDQTDANGPHKGDTPLDLVIKTNTEDEFPHTLGVSSTLPLRMQLLRTLLDSGADPNLADARGRTPLMLAVLENISEFVQILIKAGAAPDFVPPKSKNESPVALAVRRNLAKLLPLFKKAKRRNHPPLNDSVK